MEQQEHSGGGSGFYSQENKYRHHPCPSNLQDLWLKSLTPSTDFQRWTADSEQYSPSVLEVALNCWL